MKIPSSKNLIVMIYISHFVSFLIKGRNYMRENMVRSFMPEKNNQKLGKVDMIFCIVNTM